MPVSLTEKAMTDSARLSEALSELQPRVDRWTLVEIHDDFH